MTSVTEIPLGVGPAQPRRRGRRVLLTIAALAAVGLLMLASFLAGVRHGRQMTITTGLGAGLTGQGEIEAGGWWYAVSGIGSVMWTDGTGALHDGGWPTCLNQAKQIPVKFGWVPATLPDGTSLRQVVWVDCQS
jgi:hypothetical protein